MHALDSSSGCGSEKASEEWAKLGEVVDNASRVIGSPANLTALLQALILEHDQKRSLQERNAVLLEDRDRLNKLLAEQKEKEGRLEKLLQQLISRVSDALAEITVDDIRQSESVHSQPEQALPDKPLSGDGAALAPSTSSDSLGAEAGESSEAAATQPELSALPPEENGEPSLEPEASADSTSAATATAGQELGGDSSLRRLLVPEILNTPASSRYFRKWQAALSSNEPDYLLFAMLSNLFTWTCASANRKRETGGAISAALEKESCVGLYNFSRYLFDYLYANGEEPEGAEAIVFELMNGINKLLENDGEKYELMLPYLSSPYNTKTMIPDARGASTGSVYKLRSWGLKVRGSDMMHQKCLVELD